MGNKFKGELDFEHGGVTYHAVLDFNAFCEIEAVDPELTMPKLIRVLNVPKLDNVRKILYGCLQRHHRGISLPDVGDMIQDMGFERALSIVHDLGASFPQPKKDTASGNASKPEAKGKKSLKTGTAS